MGQEVQDLHESYKILYTEALCIVLNFIQSKQHFIQKAVIPKKLTNFSVRCVHFTHQETAGDMRKGQYYLKLLSSCTQSKITVLNVQQ